MLDHLPLAGTHRTGVVRLGLRVAFVLAIAALGTACVNEIEGVGGAEDPELVGSIRSTGSIDTIAFCGPSHIDPAAWRGAATLARYGIDATLGPCLGGDNGYRSPAHPGNRYASPEAYMQTLEINFAHGMQTVVYDARLWSADVNVRQAGIGYWSQVLPAIRGFDMGDEFDVGEWDELVRRITIYNQNVYPQYVAVGYPIGTFTNHLPWMIPAALQQLDANSVFFDQYGGDEGRSWVSGLEAYGVGHIGVFINAYVHGPYVPTYNSVVTVMRDLRARGADTFGIFGGFPVYDATGSGYDPSFGTTMIDRAGNPTALARAVRDGSY